jgi:hypothetical protein
MAPRIDRVTVSLKVYRGSASTLAERCGRLFFEHLAAQLAEVLESSAPVDAPLRIDRLELDLGAIALSDFESIFARRLLDRLEWYLRSHPLTLLTYDASTRRAGVGERSRTGSLARTQRIEPAAQSSPDAQREKQPAGQRTETLSSSDLLANVETQRLAHACLSAGFRRQFLSKLGEPERYALCRRMQLGAVAAARDSSAIARADARLPLQPHVFADDNSQPIPLPLAEAMVVACALICTGASASPDVTAVADQHVSVPDDARLYPWLRYLRAMPVMATREWHAWRDRLLQQPASLALLRVDRLADPDRHPRASAPDAAAVSKPGNASSSAHRTVSARSPEGQRVSDRAQSPAQILARSRLVSEEPVMVSNAGIVLLWPLLPELLGKLGLIDEDGFVDEAAQYQAARWLDFLVWGDEREPERTMLTLRLCGLREAEPVVYEDPIPDEISATIGDWLSGLPKRIPHCSRCKAGDMRELFLQRAGVLLECEDHDELQVLPHASDFLLVDLQWPLTSVPWNWLARPLQVHWKIPALPPDFKRSDNV